MVNKVRPLSAAISWLPGFGPDEDPIQVLGTVKTAKIAGTGRKVWPALRPSDIPEGMSAKDRIEANIAALRAVKSGEACREALLRYTGWGAVPKVFDAPEHQEVRAELQTLLSEKGYKQAMGSVNSAFFTPFEVCSAMWHWIAQAGFTGGKILEPSAGIGNLIGTMPEAIASNSVVTAIEKDEATASILKALYGDFGVRVVHEGFESVALAEGSFDLVVSNVPFGNFGVPEHRNVEYQKWLIHDYFFGKAMEVVRPGGLIAFLTHSGTLDKYDSSVREWLGMQADLLAAIRLPTQAFEGAGTSVSVDLVILHKRRQINRAMNGWYSAVNWSDYHSPIVNKVFKGDSRGLIVGEPAIVRTRYGHSSVAAKSDDWKKSLADAMGAFEVPTVYQGPIFTPEAEARPVRFVMDGKRKPGNYVISGDRVLMSLGVEAEEVRLSKDQEARIRAMIPVRDAAVALVKAQAKTDRDEPLEALRLELHMAYDAYVKRFGHFNDRKNIKALEEDVDFPLLLSLEKVERDGRVLKADVFYRRTARATKVATSAETLAEALQVNLAEAGHIQVGRIAGLLGWTVDEVIEKLNAEGLAFQDPKTHAFVPGFLYLSGDVKTKLEEAEIAGPGYEANVQALKKVLPQDIPACDIHVRFGANWIPASVYGDFFREVLGVSIQPSYIKATGTWVVSGSGLRGKPEFSTMRVNTKELVEVGLNQREPKVVDRKANGTYEVNVAETLAAKEKLEAIREAFAKWVWADKERMDSLVRVYNDRMNRHVPTEWDGSMLALPGFSDCVRLHQHQRDVIWRMVVGKKNCLIAHCVGAGKTLSMICAAMEMRRTGKASKPLIVVPNHMLHQFAKEFLQAYPGASVLVAGKDDLAGDKRRIFTAKVATWDWDAVIMTHSTFEKVQPSREMVESFIEENLAKVEVAIASENGNARKQIERLKASLEAKLERLSSRGKKDDLIEFKELGVDALFVDEAHLFKNVWRFTRMERIAGLPVSDSQRSFDMLMKVREIASIRGDETGVFFATGTPVANSVAELWVMQHYLQQGDLEKVGYANFDSWAANFGMAVTGIEMRPDGAGYRVNTRFARFINVPELMALFGQVADIKTKEMVNLPTPAVVRETVTAKATPELRDYIQGLAARVEMIQKGEVKPYEDNMLAVTTDGRKAATDMRLVGGHDQPWSKINLCVEKVHSIWLETAESRGTQVVFLDLGTPGPDRHWSLYEDIRDKLVGRGVPAEEIAFIHDAETDGAKEALFAKVREGAVRVLLGSTSKMGVGTNIQTRLVALHHVDAPWRPADVEQREGRIERQGNRNASVRIIRYVTEESFDAYMWGVLETKAKFIAQVMSGGKLRSVEDLELSALSYAEVKALATGNPLIIEKAGVDSEVNRLLLLRRQWEKETSLVRWQLQQLPALIASCRRRLEAAKRDTELLVPVRDKDFALLLKGRTITNRKEAANRLMVEILRASPYKGCVEIGSYAGLTLCVEAGRNGTVLILKGERSHEVGGRIDKENVLDKLLDLVRQVEREPEKAALDLSRFERELEQAKARAGEDGWEHEERFRRLLARQAEIDEALGIGEDAKVAFTEEGEKEAA